MIRKQPTTKKEWLELGYDLTKGFLILILMHGWIINFSRFTELNFEPSYKAEVIRGIGIPVAPVGGIIGWITFKEEKKEK